MPSLLPPLSPIKNNIVQYSKLRYLSSIIENNNEGLMEYACSTPWSIPNQHPLVKFLTLLSLDIYKSDEFIYNEIAYKYKQIASLCKMTCLYNKGTAFVRCLFPEKEHHTLLVVPFIEDRPFDTYFNQSIKTLSPLTTLYTTDTILRYDTTALTSATSTPHKSDYTVVQVDPFALAVGYVKYCRELTIKDASVGMNPRAYLTTSPLANFFIQHNQYVIANLIEGDGIHIEKTKWNKIDFTRELAEYLSFQRRHEGIITFKSFSHYLYMIMQGKTLGGGLQASVYPDAGLSKQFNQLSWVYNYGEMGWARKYLDVIKKYGREDKVFNYYTNAFLRHDIKYLTASIAEPLWKNLYTNMFNDLNDLIK